MKVFAFVPIRLSSSRLPSKALLDLEGFPCIRRLIDRIKKTPSLDGIIICTTKNSSDDQVEIIAKELEVFCFRGDEKDVLERYRGAVETFQVDYVINVDGDDIFCDPSFIEKTIEELIEKDLDFVMWNNMPLGSTPIGIKSSAILKVCKLKDTKDTETGWTKFFTDTGLFEIKYLSEDLEFFDTDTRLTLDYPQDLELFRKIYQNLQEPFSINDILKLLNKKPELKNINKNLVEIYKKNFESKSTKVKMRER